MTSLYTTASNMTTLAQGLSNMKSQVTLQAQQPKAKCKRTLENTLTTDCYSACGNGSIVCVNYAARPSNESDKEGDGNFYYQGCKNTPPCKTDVGPEKCELQCLPALTPELVYNVAPPQGDLPTTSLFKHVDKLALPASITKLSIVGSTKDNRWIPMTFAEDAFMNAPGLQKLMIQRLDVKSIKNNIFPSNLTSLTMQSTQLTEFEPPRQPLIGLRTLDLSANNLTMIPMVVYDLKELTSLNLLGNTLVDVQVTSSQLSFLRKLNEFKADLVVTSGCPSTHYLYIWDNKQVCCGEGDMSTDGMNGVPPRAVNTPTTTGQGNGHGLTIIISGVVVAVVLAILAGVFFLKRARLRATKQQCEEESGTTKYVASLTSFPTSKKGKICSPNELVQPLRRGESSESDISPQSIKSDNSVPSVMCKISPGSGVGDGGVQNQLRKTSLREIPAKEVHESGVLVHTSVVSVSMAEYQNTKVTVHRLKVSDEKSTENGDLSLSVTPVIFQMRHPQLLSVLGVMWDDDMHTMSVVCEDMNRGTLEDLLLSAQGMELTWAKFKLRAALDVAGCLMYIHNQLKLTYNGLSGQTVLVDTNKGCKLSTLITALPSGVMRSHKIRSMRAFCAPEVLAGGPPVPASDMYSFGVLLAQLDTCQTANDMIRSSLRQHSMEGLSTSSSSIDTPNQQSQSIEIDTSRSLLSLFTFTSECPSIVIELASSCLQYDPSMRPSAQYVTAMLQQVGTIAGSTDGFMI